MRSILYKKEHFTNILDTKELNVLSNKVPGLRCQGCVALVTLGSFRYHLNQSKSLIPKNQPIRVQLSRASPSPLLT